MLVGRVKAEEAAGVLGLPLEGLTDDVLKKAYRSAAKDCHPDHHGTDKLQQWSRVSWAKGCLDNWLAHHPVETAVEIQLTGDCGACGGSGRVRVGTGFSKLTMQCVICKGLGTVLAEENDHD